MGSNGNITKISNGHLTETAQKEYTSYAKTMQSNAAKKVNEHSGDGVVFGEPKDMKYQTVDTIDIVAGIFFDGTLNNKFNTDNKITGKGKGSYGNDYSNIARLFTFYQEIGNIISIYTEGIGTQINGLDDTPGKGFGAGDTGILKKVKIGCENLLPKISKVAGKKTINKITFDVFGFSRGAAAARNFIYEITKPSYRPVPFWEGDKVKYYLDEHEEITMLEIMPAGGILGKMLAKSNIKVKKLHVRFVGLFDTVSSYSESGFSIAPKFDNDVKELHLDQIYRADKIVHFTAADEHRKFFALTHIQTMGKNRIEIEFPGVHSDIGGSYHDGFENVDEILDGEERELIIEKRRLVNDGWYLDKQLTVHSFLEKLSGKRYVHKQYSYIPLSFMCEFACDKSTQVNFDQKGLNEKYNIDEVKSINPLNFIRSKLHNYAFNGGSALEFKYYKQLQDDLKSGKITGRDYNQQLVEQKNIRELRNKFLHWSADYDGLGDPFKPNFENNKRKRITYEG